MPESDSKPFGETFKPYAEIHGLLDCAEQHIIDRVRARVREEVREKLLSEFAALVQAETEKALAEISFDLASQQDMLTRQDRLHVLITWAKAKEGKKRFRETANIVEEVL